MAFLILISNLFLPAREILVLTRGRSYIVGLLFSLSFSPCFNLFLRAVKTLARQHVKESLPEHMLIAHLVSTKVLCTDPLTLSCCYYLLFCHFTPFR